MRRLHLSERRDSFKKQEAVQEVSFDEPPDPGEDTTLPRIAVQGAEAGPTAQP
jgi:microtubule-associated serine/threonine kinase